MSTEHNLILRTQQFGLRGRQENYGSLNENLKFVKDENGRAYVMLADLGPVYRREVTPANRATLGGLTSHTGVSLKNALKRLRARQGSPSTRGTLSTCPGHPSCKRFMPGFPC